MIKWIEALAELGHTTDLARRSFERFARVANIVRYDARIRRYALRMARRARGRSGR